MNKKYIKPTAQNVALANVVILTGSETEIKVNTSTENSTQWAKESVDFFDDDDEE